jgi:hypothetical protein
VFFIVNIIVFAIELPHLKKKGKDVEDEGEEAGNGRDRGT